MLHLKNGKRKSRKKAKKEKQKKKENEAKLSENPKVFISIPAGKKRCPNGYVKDVPTGKCRKKELRLPKKASTHKKKS